MAKKFLKTLTNNFGFKVLAFVFACALWLVVYNIDDPTKTKTYTTSVVIENAEVLSNMNKYYEIVDGTGQVSFSVSAKRSVLDKLENSNFTAVADMNTMTLEDDGLYATIPLRISSDKHENSLKYNGKNKYLRIALEDLMTKQFVISANTKGSVADGYALGDVTISGSNILKISGPASVVETVDAAVAVINVDGISTTISDSVIPMLYDAEGNVVDTTKLNMSISSVSISAIVMGTKNVPVVFKTTGKVAEDYAIASVTSDPNSIRVKGSASALNAITSLELPENLIDVTGLTESLKTTVDISDYLPEGVTAVNAGDTVFTVTIEVDHYETRTYKVPTSGISVLGVTTGHEVAFDDKEIAVTIGGTTSVLDKLSAEGIALTLDVTGLSEGEHYVALRLAADNATYELVGANASVKISKSTGVSAGVDNAGNSTDSNAEGASANEDKDKSKDKEGDHATGSANQN